MKIISLFTKAPQHQRFSYKPRYYNPQQDEMKEREERIRKELERERALGDTRIKIDYRVRRFLDRRYAPLRITLDV